PSRAATPASKHTHTHNHTREPPRARALDHTDRALFSSPLPFSLLFAPRPPLSSLPRSTSPLSVSRPLLSAAMPPTQQRQLFHIATTTHATDIVVPSKGSPHKESFIAFDWSERDSLRWNDPRARGRRAFE